MSSEYSHNDSIYLKLVSAIILIANEYADDYRLAIICVEL